MVGAMPILLGLAAAVVARERLTLRHWILLLVSAAGALLIASGSNEHGDSGRGPSVIGDALVLLSVLAAVTWVLTSKRLMARYDSGFVSALVQIVGTVRADVRGRRVRQPRAGRGALLGVIVLGEHLGWSGVLGGVLVVGAAVAVTRR